MQKKNGYLSVRAMTRKDRVKVNASRYNVNTSAFHVEPHIHEGATFLNEATGQAFIELPPAVAGRKFHFIANFASIAVDNATFRISPYSGIYSTDRIFDPDAADYMPAGYDLISGVTGYAQLTLECQNDGFWTVTHISDTWEAAARSFEILFTDDNGVSSDTAIMGMAIPIEVLITATNEKFIDTIAAANITIVGDMADPPLTQNNDVVHLNDQQITFTLGDGAEELVVNTGINDFEIDANRVLSGVKVEGALCGHDVAGITDTTNSLDDSAATKVWTFIIEVENETIRADIDDLHAYVQLEEELAGLTIDTLALNLGRDELTITTLSGAVGAGTSQITINPAAFEGNILASGIPQTITGTISP